MSALIGDRGILMSPSATRCKRLFCFEHIKLEKDDRMPSWFSWNPPRSSDPNLRTVILNHLWLVAWKRHVWRLARVTSFDVSCILGGFILILSKTFVLLCTFEICMGLLGVRNCQRQGSFNHRDVFPHSRGGWKARIQAPAAVPVPERSLWLADTACLRCPSTVFLCLLMSLASLCVSQFPFFTKTPVRLY